MAGLNRDVIATGAAAAMLGVAPLEWRKALVQQLLTLPKLFGANSGPTRIAHRAKSRSMRHARAIKANRATEKRRRAARNHQRALARERS